MTTKLATALEFETRIDISEPVRESMVELLNQQLADSLDLYTQVKQAHWNVKGMKFMSLHLLFDNLAANFLRYADTIAERATALGGRAMGTVRMAAANSQLDELSCDLTEGDEFLVAMSDRFARYAASSRTAINRCEMEHDAVTADLFTEITREVDKSLYFLESHLQG
ncbi:MAG: DNA starvation/stationary phase protection protein Dps [Planctomycetales bacterium]|nr:DNA starvation/stationary phase protection protein Dps [Planctomycetales bacterium]